VCPSPPSCGFHAQSPCVDQLRDLCQHPSSYPHIGCSYYQCFEHDVDSCPYYNVFDEFYARLSEMIETMNE